MNQVIIIGRLTKDPEIKYSASGVAYGNYNLAVDRPKKKGAEKAETDFILCKVLGKQAEFAEKYLKQGTKIAISGSLQVDKYKDKDGNNRSQTYVLALNHEFCESRGNASAHPNTNSDQPPLSNQSENYGWMNIPDGVDDPNLPFN